MSVVKKYQSGGGLTKGLEDFLDKKIESAKFTSPGLTHRQDKLDYKEQLKRAARQWADYTASPEFKESYKYDKLTDLYTVDPTKLSEKFQGQD